MEVATKFETPRNYPIQSMLLNLVVDESVLEVLLEEPQQSQVPIIYEGALVGRERGMYNLLVHGERDVKR